MRAKDAVGLIVEISNPKIGFETKHSPGEPSEEELKRNFKIKMWELRVKRFLDREENIPQNMSKIYSIVIWPCLPALRSDLKGDA